MIREDGTSSIHVFSSDKFVIVIDDETGALVRIEDGMVCLDADGKRNTMRIEYAHLFRDLFARALDTTSTLTPKEEPA